MIGIRIGIGIGAMGTRESGSAEVDVITILCTYTEILQMGTVGLVFEVSKIY